MCYRSPCPEHGGCVESSLSGMWRRLSLAEGPCGGACVASGWEPLERMPIRLPHPSLHELSAPSSPIGLLAGLRAGSCTLGTSLPSTLSFPRPGPPWLPGSPQGYSSCSNCAVSVTLNASLCAGSPGRPCGADSGCWWRCIPRKYSLNE